MTRTRLGKRHVPWIAIVVLALAVAGCSRPAVAVDIPLETKPSARAEAVLARAADELAKQELVGLSMAIAEGGHIVLVQHFGFEDREHGVRTNDETRYRWASISKPMTAVVAMQLANEKKLDLDVDVRRYVSEFPEKPWPITARELLCHQGGIVHYTNGPVIASPERTDVEHPYFDAVDALATFGPSPLVHEPGTKYSYSTRGYMLLGAVEQRAAGIPYPRLVHERIANPLGMTTLQPDYAWVAIEHRAVGYKKDGKGLIVPSDDVDVSWKLPGGGFLSNVEDLARFSIGLVEEKIVDHATREKMWTRQRTRDGAETTYGLGFVVGTRNGRREIHHSGAQEKTRTFLLMLPERHVSVALMTNSEYAELGGLARVVADAWTLER